MITNVHVVPTGNRWAVESGSTGHVIYPTQEDAIAAGTVQAKKDSVELLIHGRDGLIHERKSFGHDERIVKGIAESQ